MNPMQNVDGNEPTGNRAQRRAASRRSKKLVAMGSGAVLVAGITGPTVLSQSPVSAAATFTVTSLGDSGAGTLRDAIDSANSAAGDDIINFQTGLTGTITLASDLPKLYEAVAIEGPGATVVTVDGGGTSSGGGNSIFNFYQIASGTNSVSGLTLTHGTADNDDGSGGAITVIDGSSDVNLTDLVITENYAENDGGGVELENAAGNVTITNTVISNNNADSGGGGLYADSGGEGTLTVTINNSTISGNTAGSSGGGLYANDIDLVINDSTISGNDSYSSGGGLYLDDTTATVTNSTISGNTAAGGGGGVALYNSSNYSFTMRNSTVSGNSTLYYGGGFYINDSSEGPVTIENSTISDNTATKNAGAIYGAYGGLTIIQTTITDNHVIDSGAEATVGGVQLGGTPNGAAPQRAHKTAREQARGKTGRRAQATPPMAGNAEMELVGTIIAGNDGQDIGIYGGAPTVSSDHSVLGTIDPGVPVTADVGTQLGVADPKLGLLASNGGPTKTHALLDGSPALDKGPNPEPTFTGSEFDQRGPGYDRVSNGVADVGAYEVQFVEPPAPPAPAVEPEVVPTFTG